MSCVVGLDLSLRSTGCCAIDDDSKSVIACCLVNAEKDVYGVQRLAFLINRISYFVEKHKPRMVAIEGYAFASNMAYAREIAELGGIVKLWLHRAHVPFELVAPTKLKKFATGKGNAKKNQMLLAVYKKWGVEFSNDNEADAYALARFAAEPLT